MRKLLLAGLGLMFSAVLAGAPAQTLRIGLAEDPDLLDPTLARTYVGRIVFASLCDKLVDISPELDIVPQLATEWQWVDGNKGLVMKIRQGVKFQDGEPLDAAAVKFSLERHLTLPGSNRKAEISAVTAVDVVDDHTVKLVLSAPFAPLLAQLSDRAGMIVSPKAAQAAGDKFGNHPVCAGPYKFAERIAQDRIVLEKFAGHYDAARFAVQRIVFLPIPDTSVRFANLRAGQLEMIERLAPNDIDAIKKSGNLGYVGVTGLGYQGITFNLGNGPKADNPFGRDKRVRQALDLSIDRAAVNEVVYRGEYTVGNQPVPPHNPHYAKTFPVPTRDVARARALLKEAGVEHPVLNLLVPNSNDDRAAAEMIQAMAAEAGIEIRLQAIEFITMLQYAREGNFEADYVGWSGRIDTDANIHTLLACKAPGNDGRYCSVDMEKGLDAARLTSDDAERAKIYEGVMRELVEDKPILYLWHQKWLWGFTNRLEGYVPYPDGLIRLRDVRVKS
jgi:peptide/nickel transport system substrate-binding protein